MEAKRGGGGYACGYPNPLIQIFEKVLLLFISLWPVTIVLPFQGEIRLQSFSLYLWASGN